MAILNRSIARGQAKGEAHPLRLKPWLIAAGIAILAIAVLQLYQTSRATTASFQMQDIEQQKLELDTSVRQLEAEVASLSSLARIEQEAQRLGLQPAEERDTVQVNVAPPPQGLRLPSRFAPDEAAGLGGQHASWWHKLRGLFPH